MGASTSPGGCRRRAGWPCLTRCCPRPCAGRVARCAPGSRAAARPRSRSGPAPACRSGARPRAAAPGSVPARARWPRRTTRRSALSCSRRSQPFAQRAQRARRAGQVSSRRRQLGRGHDAAFHRAGQQPPLAPGDAVAAFAQAHEYRVGLRPCLVETVHQHIGQAGLAGAGGVAMASPRAELLPVAHAYRYGKYWIRSTKRRVAKFILPIWACAGHRE